MKLYRIKTDRWYIGRIVLLVGGVFVTGSVFLGMFVHENWLYFTAFVGVMFMNFALTGFCPMAIILDKFGVARGEITENEKR